MAFQVAPCSYSQASCFISALGGTSHMGSAQETLSPAVKPGALDCWPDGAPMGSWSLPCSLEKRVAVVGVLIPC